MFLPELLMIRPQSLKIWILTIGVKPFLCAYLCRCLEGLEWFPYNPRGLCKSRISWSCYAIFCCFPVNTIQAIHYYRGMVWDVRVVEVVVADFSSHEKLPWSHSIGQVLGHSWKMRVCRLIHRDLYSDEDGDNFIFGKMTNRQCSMIIYERTSCVQSLPI